MTEATETHLLTPGSIVWAKVNGYPWWPAMIDHDPDERDYVWTKEGTDVPTHYHVVFLDDDVTRSWVKPDKIKCFEECNTLKEMGPFVLKGKDYRKEVKVAIEAAMVALNMTTDDRLRKYSFVNRYKQEKPTATVAETEATDSYTDVNATAKQPKKRKPNGRRNETKLLRSSNAPVVGNDEVARLYASIKGILDEAEKIVDSADDLESILNDPDFFIESQKSDNEDFEEKPKKRKKKKSVSKKAKVSSRNENPAKAVTSATNNAEDGKVAGEVVKRKRGRPRKIVINPIETPATKDPSNNAEQKESSTESTTTKFDEKPAIKKVEPNIVSSETTNPKSFERKKFKPVFGNNKKLVEIPLVDVSDDDDYVKPLEGKVLEE